MVFFLRWNVGTTQVWCAEARQPTKSWTGWEHWQEIGIHLDRSALSLDSRLYRLLRLNSMNVQSKSSGLAVIYLCSKKEFIQSIYCTLYMLVYSQIQYTF